MKNTGNKDTDLMLTIRSGNPPMAKAIPSEGKEVLFMMAMFRGNKNIGFKFPSVCCGSVDKTLDFVN